MKNKMYYLVCLLILGISQKISAQATVTPNTGTAANYIGWNSTQPQDLTIKHENNRFINFYTNAGLGGFANPRMRILSGGLTGNGATTDGFIGIGDFNFFAPLNLLHQHLNYNRSNFHQFTNLNTGNTATDGSLFGIEYRTATNPGVNYSLATIRQKENAPIYFYTTDSLRMVINENRSGMIYYPASAPLNTNGFVGIAHSLWGQNFMRDFGPLSMLHLEGPNNFTFRGLGYRKWMRTGTYASENSDFVYIGMKPEAYLASNAAYNRSDAIIAWGDDMETFKDSTDKLRILFSGYSYPEGSCNNCPLNHQGYDAYEVARFTPPNVGFGAQVRQNLCFIQTMAA